MTPYDVIRPHRVNGLMLDKMKSVCVCLCSFVGGSDCWLHMDIPTYEQNLFWLIWKNYIQLVLVIYRFLLKRYENHFKIAQKTQ